MNVATKHSYGIRSEIPTPEELYQGRDPPLTSRKSSRKSAKIPKPWETQEGRGPYLDIVTFKSSSHPGDISEALDQLHTRLLIEPVLIPDLSHTGVSMNITEQDQDFLFYPNGRKNNRLTQSIFGALGPTRTKHTANLRQAMTQPDMNLNHSQRFTVSTRGDQDSSLLSHQVSSAGLQDGSLVTGLTTLTNEEEERRMIEEGRMMMEGEHQHLAAISTEYGLYKIPSQEEEEEEASANFPDPDYASHHRMSTHFAGKGKLRKQEADILKAGLSRTVKVKKSKSSKSSRKKKQSAEGQSSSRGLRAVDTPQGIASAMSQRRRANQETKKVLATLRQNNQWLHSLVNI